MDMELSTGPSQSHFFSASHVACTCGALSVGLVETQ